MNKKRTEAAPALVGTSDIDPDDLAAFASALAGDPSPTPEGEAEASAALDNWADDGLTDEERLEARTRGIKGHRPLAAIRADLDKARRIMTAMIRAKDQLADRETTERLIYEAERGAAIEMYKKVHRPWSEQAWASKRPKPFKISGKVGDDLHQQHYVVARLENELEALLAAAGATAHL